MNAPHLHLLVTHVPVLGTVFGLCLLLLALARRSDELKRTSLLVFFVAGMLAIPAYVSGEPAADHLKRIFAGTMADATDQHSEIAVIALTMSLIAGLLALFALVFYRGGKKIGHRAIISMLVVSLATAVLLGWTANLGAKIRHTEIRSDAAR